MREGCGKTEEAVMREELENTAWVEEDERNAKRRKFGGMTGKIGDGKGDGSREGENFRGEKSIEEISHKNGAGRGGSRG